MNLRITRRFQSEAFAIENRLDGERIGYGQRFLTDLNEIVHRILDHPRIFQRCDDSQSRHEIREAFLERFEYRLFYRILQEETIELLTLIHAKSRLGTIPFDDSEYDDAQQS